MQEGRFEGTKEKLNSRRFDNRKKSPNCLVNDGCTSEHIGMESKKPTEEQTKQVAVRLRKFREERHLSQLELSMLSSVSQNMITYIETGKRTPTLTTLLKICNALSIKPALLFSSEDDARVLARKDMHRLVDEYF